MDDVLTMTTFSAKELKRIVDLFPQTDPRTRDYAQLCENLERFAASIGNVDWVLGLTPPDQKPQIVQFNPPTAEDEKFEEPAPVEAEPVEETPAPVEEVPAPVEEEDTAEDAPKYEASEVKAAIARARAAKKIGSPKAWIQEVAGVDGFDAIPAAKYGLVMQKLKELGVD